MADGAQIGDGGHFGGDVGHADDGTAVGRNASHGQFPGLLQHIEADDDKGERRKAESENGEGGKKLANDIELRQRDYRKKSP